MSHDDRAALAALLVAGHSLADFVFQTRWMVENKHRAAGILAHGAVVAVCQGAALVPYLGGPALLAVAAITATHLIIDALKTAFSQRVPSRELEAFVLDQLVHVVTLALAWVWLAPRAQVIDERIANPVLWRSAGILVAAYAFNVNGVSAVVTLVLVRCRIAPRVVGPSGGRVIGILERMFALTLILLDHWDALGFLVAAKSLARFKDLDERSRAEYYLVGTLLSLLGATAAALLASALLRSTGSGL